MSSKGSMSLRPDIKVRQNENKPPTKSTTQPPPKPEPSSTTSPISMRPKRGKKNSSISSYTEYKPKPYDHKYREYKPTYETPKYKPYVPTQIQFKGNVEYKLTKDNFHPMNHWKSRSLDDSIPKKYKPIVPLKDATPPPPPKTSTPTPPPPPKTPTPTPPPPKSPTPPPPKAPTPEPRRQPSPKPLPVILVTKKKEKPPPLPALTPLPPVHRPPPSTQRFYWETKYPSEVIACVRSYLMASRHVPYKQYRLPYWIVQEYF